MGARFDPDQHCRYTGAQLYQQPIPDCGGGYMVFYVRGTDGENMKCRRATDTEIAWIVANPKAYAFGLAQFRQWREGLRRAKYA